MRCRFIISRCRLRTTATVTIMSACLLGLRPASGSEIILTPRGITPQDRLVVLVFDSATAFNDLRAPLRTLVPGVEERHTIRITGLEPGEYACVVYVDENRNGRLDRNFIGIPTEPIGFSNAYRPKGPPSYERAAFSVSATTAATQTIALQRTLGRRGQLGVGIGVITSSSPYRDAKKNPWQVIPALTYVGERVQILGPALSVGLFGAGPVRLALKATYRSAAYEEDDAPVLAGLGDRKSTLMAGPALQWEVPGGLDLSLSYAHDVLNAIGGGAARVGVDRSFPWKHARFTPSAGLTWRHADLANHDFGVPPEHAHPGRPAYVLEDTLSVEAGIGIFLEVSSSIRIFTTVALEFMDPDASDSPIVERAHVVKAIMAASYAF